MVKRKRETSTEPGVSQERLNNLSREQTVGGVPGPGRWLIVRYKPTTLFSLKVSLATSSVGKSLIVPTPYSIKIALVDAAFRNGISEGMIADFLVSLRHVDVRIAPVSASIVTHTFVKIRQEPHSAKECEPYTSSIAYREIVHVSGIWRLAFDLAGCDDACAEHLVELAPHVSYVGKRGSFIQYFGMERLTDLGSDFTYPMTGSDPWTLPERAHIFPLDDFGPEATLDILSSYSLNRAYRDKHRRFVRTVIPAGVSATGPGFTEYRT